MKMRPWWLVVSGVLACVAAIPLLHQAAPKPAHAGIRQAAGPDPRPLGELGRVQPPRTPAVPRAGKPVPDGECRACQPDGTESAPRVELSGGGASWLAGIDSRGRIELPGGRLAKVVVERREQGADGGLVLLEGRVDAPPGRFLFRRELSEGKAWPMWGFVDLFDQPEVFRVENDGGRSFLAEVSADLVVCRQLGIPPTGEVAAVDGEVEEIPANHPTNIPIPAYQNGIVPLQSLPGANAVIYLDFDGEAGPHEGWGDFVALPAQLSSNPATATSQVKEVWQRVAEDYAPFHINVTTDLQVFLDAPETSRQRCILTPTTNAAPGAGGVAYLGSFNSSGDQPCWSFYSTGKSAAEVVSHEVGHTLNLSHDGRTSPAEGYYTGHGTDPVGWAPIMGVGYYKNLTQWSKGEYLGANQKQDDLAVIANNNNVAARVDDCGDTLATAKHLEIQANNTVGNEGLIASSADVDAFRFKTSGGSVSFTVSPVAAGPDLDILAEVRDATGALIASGNPDTALNASVNATLTAGEYTLQVSGVGRGDPLADGYTDYASLGAYTVTGSVVGGEKPDRFSIAENPAAAAAVGTVAPRLAHGGNPLGFAISSGNSGGAFAIDAGTGQLTVADPAMFDFETLSTSWEVPAVHELFVTVTDTVDSLLNESVRVVVTVTDVNEAPVLTGGAGQVPVGSAAGTAVFRVSAADPDRFQSCTFAITDGNAEGWFAIDAATGLLTLAVPPATSGSHILTVRGTDSGSPANEVTTTVVIEVYAIPAGYTPGTVNRTIYDGIAGSTVASLTGSAKFPTAPDREIALGELADGSRGDSHGSTVRAFVLAPLTGSYTFWIASDDASELRLGTSADPATATVRASVSSYTGVDEWTKFASQKSAAINLTAGQAYYLEVRHKENYDNDHFSVAWQISVGGDIIVPRQIVPARCLAPHFLNYKPILTNVTVALYETAYNGSTVASMVASDPNPGQTRSYAITGGNGAGAFGIEPASGRVFVADRSKLNSVVTPSHALTVAATDDGTPALTGSGVLTVEILPGSRNATTDLVHEVWDGISGTALANLYASPKWPNKPDRVRLITELDSGSGISDNYGARIRAFVIPPATGSYTFYLASDDEGVLLLSSNDNPANATAVATVATYADARQWTKFTSQTSAAVALTAGQRYYLEARVKEGGGGDHLSVGWTGPGITSVTVPSGPEVAAYDSNLPPGFAAGSYSFSVDATAAPGTVVGSVAATDLSFETITYGIAGGNPGGFLIDPQTGLIRLMDPFQVTGGQTYVLQVGAQDDGYGRLFPPRESIVPVTVQVTGVSPNRVPVVAITNPAGDSVGVPDGAGLVLSADVSDDGKPNPPAMTGVSWSTVSGPGSVAFFPADEASTAANFPAAGNYVLRVTASDGELAASDEIAVVVGGTAGGNAGPLPNAGGDQAMPVTGGTLVGTVSDDGNPAVGAVTYIPRAATGWRYRKGTSEASSPTDAWRLAGFAENGSWLTGQLPVGYGSYSNNTVLADMRNSYSTVYLRRGFFIDPARIPDQLTLELWVDDGAVVWINGKEVARRHVGSGNLAYNALATNHNATWETITIPNARSFLTGGDNLLAVHCVNTTLQSNDFSWNCSLATQAEPAALTSGWSKVSGPGSVTFGTPSHPVTTVSFSAPGTYVLRLTVSDGVLTTFDDTTVSVTRPLPVANAASVSTPQDQALPINLSGSDPLNSPLTWRIVTPPAHGNLQGNPPALTYVPDAAWSGADAFAFSVNNGEDDSLPATVEIHVDGKPSALPQAFVVRLGGTLPITLAGSDPENTPLTFSVLSGPANGVLSGAAPDLTYTPSPGSSGPDNFTFLVNDGIQDSPPATVTIDIQGLPIDFWRGEHFGEQSGDPLVAGDDADPDHDGLANLLEYALRLDPWSVDVPPDRPHIELADGNLSLFFRQNLAATDVQWIVEQTSQPGQPDAWSPVMKVPESVSDDGTVRIVRVDVPANPDSDLFLRLKVVLSGPAS